MAPINSYQSVLTLLAIPHYSPLLTQQLFSTRRSIAHSVISSVLKNETIVETPEDVDGVLELCHVLVKDQSDSAGHSPGMQSNAKDMRRPGQYYLEREEMAEEQGWVARMVHLFRAESLDSQFEVCRVASFSRVYFFTRTPPQLLQVARRHFSAGGERMRFTFPALITSSIKLCRRYKNREHVVCDNFSIRDRLVGDKLCLLMKEDDWKSKVSTILKFTRQLTSILATQVEAPTIALRLFLLSAQIADECGFEDLTYDLYVQAFTVYEDSISESRAQLQAITLLIGTLASAKVFGVDNYDTLITKAALHGAKLLKKSHQATAVGLASHLWWQEAQAVEGDREAVQEVEQAGSKEDGTEGVKAVTLGLSPLNVANNVNA